MKKINNIFYNDKGCALNSRLELANGIYCQYRGRYEKFRNGLLHCENSSSKLLPSYGEVAFNISNFNVKRFRLK